MDHGGMFTLSQLSDEASGVQTNTDSLKLDNMFIWPETKNLKVQSELCPMIDSSSTRVGLHGGFPHIPKSGYDTDRVAFGLVSSNRS